MNSHSKERYRRILSRIVQCCECRTQTVQETAPGSDWEEQAADVHERYIAEVDEEIRFEICSAAQRALKRLRSGAFGLCFDCGEEISAKRLAIIPWTERCVRCQARYEKEGFSQRLAPVAYFAGVERKAA